MAKRLTPNQKAYYKEVSRIQKGIRYWLKRGYSLQIPDYVITKPARVTKKTLKKLKNVTRGTLGKTAELLQEDISIADDNFVYLEAVENFKRELLEFPPRLADGFLQWEAELESRYGVLPLGKALLSIPESIISVFQRNGHDYGQAMEEFEDSILIALGADQSTTSNLHSIAEKEDQEWNY